jgi:hypothetical protein
VAVRTVQPFTQADTAKTSNVSVGTSDTLVAATNPARVEIILTNTGANVVDVALGATAVAGQGIRLPVAMATPLSISDFTGEIRGIASGAGTTVQYADI